MEYCLGFAFNSSLTSVLLIRKTKPKWQAGLWNGVGGKIEFGETPIDAMVREFQEETGIATSKDHWKFFRLELFKDAGLHMFCTQLTEEAFCSYQSLTEEVVSAQNVSREGLETIPNLSYLVPMAKYWLEHKNELPMKGRTLHDFC